MEELLEDLEFDLLSLDLDELELDELDLRLLTSLESLDFLLFSNLKLSKNIIVLPFLAVRPASTVFGSRSLPRFSGVSALIGPTISIAK